jgi:hypothetical protein
MEPKYLSKILIFLFFILIFETAADPILTRKFPVSLFSEQA